MPTKKPPHPTSTVRPRIRVLRGPTIALGPGKVDLLRAITVSGSLAGAARALDMSYMRAWKLVQTMNDSFRKPLIELERGGAAQGGAQLTPTGRQVLALYEDMERESLAAIAGAWRRLRRLLAP
ncbi:MAG: LysR family transcriptional regulator [Acidobacteriota bacterium]